MRVFLDENVDPRLADHLTGHTVESVRSRGWFGISNGELLSRIEAEFDVLISHDRGLEHQQNWACRTLALVVLLTPSTEFPSYRAELADILEAVDNARPGRVSRVCR